MNPVCHRHSIKIVCCLVTGRQNFFSCVKALAIRAIHNPIRNALCISVKIFWNIFSVRENVIVRRWTLENELGIHNCGQKMDIVKIYFKVIFEN